MDNRTKIREQVFDIYRNGLEFFRTAGNAAGRRPESTMDGRLGWLFFLLEVFASDKDASVWQAITEERKWMHRYAEDHPTNNYTLFTGRLGLAFADLRLFRLTGENGFLDAAMARTREYYTSPSFRNGIIARPGLFDGIAGILWLTHELYLETGASWLQEYIEAYTLKLVGSCLHTRLGICWGGITNRHGGNNGYAKGTGGVAHVLNYLGISRQNSLLRSIALNAMAYERQAAEQPGFVIGIHPFDVPLAAPAEKIAVGSFGLFSGASGNGLAWWIAALQTADGRLLSRTEALAQELAAIYSEKKREMSWTLEGALGIGYLLLKLSAPADKEPDIFFVPRVGGMPEPDIPLFQPHDTRLAETWLRSCYNQTVPAVKSTCPDAFRKFLESPEQPDPGRFAAFVTEQLTAIAGDPGADGLRYCYEKEQFISSAIEDLDGSDPSDILAMDRVLQLGPAELMDLQLVRSEKVRVFGWETSDILNQRFDSRTFIEFMQSYGVKSYFYAVSGADTLHEAPMSMLKFIYDRFTGPMLVRDVLDQITSFLCGQDEDVVSVMRTAFWAKDDTHLRLVIGEMVLQGITQCMTEGLLIPKTLYHEKNIDLHSMHEPAHLSA